MNAPKKVVCFGEVLWDVLPEGRKPGGAPMNVAYHLRRLGVESILISRVGADLAGTELQNFLQSKGLNIDYIQSDTIHKTSEVLATKGADHEMHYEIVFPVAWDFIDYDNQIDALLTPDDLLVFGSLAARNKTTRDTLYKLIEKKAINLFDVNFRYPHYSKETVEHLLIHTDILKINNSELQIISEWLVKGKVGEQECIKRLQDKYDLKEIIVTKGDRGASYYTLNERYDYKAYPVAVKDTIGSGDSFLAAFISQKLKEEPIEDVLDYALALGAYVTSQAGANPAYQPVDLTRFIWTKNLENKMK